MLRYLYLTVVLLLFPAYAQPVSTVYVVQAPGVSWHSSTSARIAAIVLGYALVPELTPAAAEQFMNAAKSLPADAARRYIDDRLLRVNGLIDRKIGPRPVVLRVLLVGGANIPAFVQELASARGLGIRVETKRSNTFLTPVMVSDSWHILPPNTLREGIMVSTPLWRVVSDAWVSNR